MKKVLIVYINKNGKKQKMADVNKITVKPQVDKYMFSDGHCITFWQKADWLIPAVPSATIFP